MKLINLITVAFLIFISVVHVNSQTYEHDTILPEIYIWPGDSIGPGSDSLNIVENIIVRSLTGACTRDWAIEKITKPT